ncbi:MAG: DUF2637 domain-containing protein [Streptosporangiaceae bacterium]
MTSPLSNRLFPVLAGLAVAALTCAAFALSYEDLRQLALAGLEGKRARRYAPAYPAVYDGLVVTVLLAVFVARDSRWWVRWTRWLLLLVLIAGAVAASVQRAVKGYGPLDDTWIMAGVASAPWVAALIAIWLWMSMVKQIKSNGSVIRQTSRRRLSRRRPAHARTDPSELVPGFSPAALPPAPAGREEQEYEIVLQPEEKTEPLPQLDLEPEPEPESEPESEPGSEPETGPAPPEPVRPPSSLPTDVMLVGRPARPVERIESAEPQKISETTQPDIPMVVADAGGASAERAEDPEAGSDDWAAYAPEWNPPSRSIRSGPTPPSE